MPQGQETEGRMAITIQDSLKLKISDSQVTRSSSADEPLNSVCLVTCGPGLLTIPYLAVAETLSGNFVSKWCTVSLSCDQKSQRSMHGVGEIYVHDRTTFLSEAAGSSRHHLDHGSSSSQFGDTASFRTGRVLRAGANRE